MTQKEIDKQLDAINRNNKIYENLYSNESTILKKFGAEVRRENIKESFRKLKKAKK